MDNSRRFHCAAEHTTHQPDKAHLRCPECQSPSIFPDGHPVRGEDDDCDLIHAEAIYFCRECGHSLSGYDLIEEHHSYEPSSLIGEQVIYRSSDNIISSGFIVSIDAAKTADLTVIGFGKVEGVRSVPYSANKDPGTWDYRA